MYTVSVPLSALIQIRKERKKDWKERKKERERKEKGIEQENVLTNH
jgi:hypothetical protein